jgi:hypothetical protein
MAAPKLTFFCELTAEPLRELFADPAVIEELTSLGASVSLGTNDLSPERADVVRRLNHAGVPVVAWLLVPEDRGYWPGASNVADVVARYDELSAWSAENGLAWARVALDFEPDLREVRRLIADWRSALPGVLRRAISRDVLAGAAEAYRTPGARIRADGYQVDSYIIPFVVEERGTGSTLLERVGGIVDLSVDREVPMLYSSFFGPGALWSYAGQFPSLGVGSTGGGVAIAGIEGAKPLSWDDLSRDLRLARKWTEDIHIFSLEGCVRLGYLGRIRTLDWSEPVEPPVQQAAQIDALRDALRRVLWVEAHPAVLVGGLVAAAWLLGRASRRRPRVLGWSPFRLPCC